MDNATFHRKSRRYELAREVDCIVLFLPPYSPDLNPIEKFWAWLKCRIRDMLSSCDCFYDALWSTFNLNDYNMEICSFYVAGNPGVLNPWTAADFRHFDTGLMMCRIHCYL